MQIPSFLWIVLCLIAVTSSRTVRSTYNETGEHGNPLKSHQKDEGPAPDFDADFENGTYSEGDTVRLHCFPRGETPMTFEWYYESGDLVEETKSISIVKSSNESYLVIDNVQLSDTGLYLCDAENSHGMSSKLFSVFVMPRSVCDCGENSRSCKYEDGTKVCDCRYGYAEKDGQCENCFCGENSYVSHCKYENGEKVCDCHSGYAQNDGQCEICYCGENSLSCKYDNGEKVCNCRPGYAEKGGHCEKISNSSTTFPPTVTTTIQPTGTEIATYLMALVAASVLSAIVFMIVAFVMWQRNRVKMTV